MEFSSPESSSETPSLPSLPSRIVKVFLSPASLFDALTQKPAVLGAALVSVVFVAVTALLIPSELYLDFARQTILESGEENPLTADQLAAFMRWGGVIGGPIFFIFYAAVFALVPTLLFKLLLGDQGTFRQYFSVAMHAFLIMAIVGLALTPLRNASESLEFTLNLGALAGGGDDSYLGRLLTSMDLVRLWALAIFALGVSRVDPRRSWGSAAIVILGLDAIFHALVALI